MYFTFNFVTDMDVVWARDPVEGFVLGRVTELMEDGVEVTPLSVKFAKRVCPFSDVYEAGEHERVFDDNCMILIQHCVGCQLNV